MLLNISASLASVHWLRPERVTMRKCGRGGPCITVSVYAVATRSWNWSSVLHHTHKGGAAFVQMCVRVCAFVTYWVECGLQLCLIIFNFSLHRLHISWTVSAFQSHLCCPCCPPPSCFSPQPPQPKTPEVPWSETDSAVFHLSDESFDSFLEEHPAALVMFYAPCE